MSGARRERADPLLEVLEALEALEIRHHLGGSYASSIHGTPRQTLDADLVVDLPPAAVPRLAALLRSRFYLDEERIRQAVDGRSSFNVIHLDSGFKVDLFVKGRAELDELELRRSVSTELPESKGRRVPVKSPEDTVLRKLQWFEEGGRVSDRQWRDVLGVLKVQGERLDREYLEEWTAELGLTTLWEKAVREAG